MIKIFNIRGGFANNSSSSHSIIFKSIPIELTDNYSADLQFGWDTFTIGSKQGVLDYLKAILTCNFKYEMNNDYIKCIVEGWVGPIPSADLPSIDHQSIVSLPYTYEEDAINKQFFMEFKELLLSQDTVILGGNDNGGEHPLEDLPGTVPELLIETSGYIAKKDDRFDYWTFFNRSSGDKFRCVLNKNGLDKSIIPTRASAPDLVDIKITDYCTFNCDFCYQGSTKNGKHAPFSDISTMVDILSRNEVLEIAYGGGEPTQHPDFIRILEYTKSKFIVPNFTTKNINWLKDNFPKISHIIGSCAVSVTSLRDVHRVATVRDFYEVRSQQICAQVVMGTIKKNELQEIIKFCSEKQIPLTLLGYKTTGRGDSYRWKVNYDNWLEWVAEVLKTSQWYKIGIDTALVKEYDTELKQTGIPNWLYHSEEGLFSWYIDAVDHKMGPSSYEPTTPYNNIYTCIDTYLEYGDQQEKPSKPKRKRSKK